MLIFNGTLRNAMMTAAMWFGATKLRSNFSYRTSILVVRAWAAAPFLCPAHVRLVRAALAHRNQRLNAPPKFIGHHPRFDSLACRRAFAPTPCEVRLRTTA
jgi:uncharacterized protein (DUF1800 family)